MVVVEKYLEHFDRNFDQMMEEMYDKVPKDYPKFMKEEQTQRAFVKKSYMSGMGMPSQNRDSQRLPLDEPFQGPIAFYQPVTYRLGYQIERQAIEDELWGMLANRPANMLYGSQIVMDMSATDILNNGTVLQTYDFGGLPLFSTAHVREDGAATWANRISSNQPITVETLFQAIVDLLVNLKDSRGFPIGYAGTINVYVPMISPTLWRQAVEVANSLNNPNTSDNRVNAVMKQFNFDVIPLRFLTNSDAWFIGWLPSAPNYGLTMVVRSAVDITPLKQFGDNPDAWYSRLRQRFVAGYENKRGIARIGA